MTKSALVIGAGGAVGEATARALLTRGWRVTASMRTPRTGVMAQLAALGARVEQHDLNTDDWRAAAEGQDAIVFAARLELSVAALQRKGPLPAHIVAFSSNNVAIHPDAPTYRAIAQAEARLLSLQERAAIIRPTLIYGDPRLATVTRLLRMASHWPFLPLPGAGHARVQPVFHEDLGVLAAGLAEGCAPGVFAAGGPDITTMRGLYEATLNTTNSRALVLPIPGAILVIAAPVLSMLGLFTGAQAERSDLDRVAVAASPIPADLAPRTDLATGLARHWAAMSAARE